LAKSQFYCTQNQDFSSVISHCASVPRKNQAGTWITKDMIHAYQNLHKAGYAHSIEVYDQKTLVGGLYGVAIGGCFFGESMFSLRPGASKIAFVHLAHFLVANGFTLLDCQLPNPYLKQFGVQTVPRDEFLKRLKLALQKRTTP